MGDGDSLQVSYSIFATVSIKGMLRGNVTLSFKDILQTSTA